MENEKNNKNDVYYNNSIPGKSKGHYSSTLLSGTDAEQYLAAQKHLKTQKQFYEQSNNSRHAPKLPLYYQTQKSFQPSAIPQQSNTIPLSLNPPSFSTTQTVSNSDKSGHNNADSFSIGNELDQLLTVQRGSEKQVEPLSEASSFPFQENNNIFFKYQDDNDIESLLNDPNFLDFNLIPDNPQWHSNELLVSTNQPPDHKEQVQQVSNENERYESDVFNEIVSLAQNHNPIKNVHTSSLEYNEQTTENKDSNLIPEEIDYRNIQYDDYYFHGIPNFQNHYNRNFKLEIVQQPERARMCGYGNKDRRPITPPPIVKLVVTSEDGCEIDPESFDTSFMILMCDSCQNEYKQDTEVSNETSPQLVTFSSKKETSVVNIRNLVGSSVSSATKLYDLDGNLGIFFIFQDISLRTEGRFRLKFSLIDIGSQYSHTVNATSTSEVIATIYTDAFTVYTAKNFPGVVESTPLTQCFSRQGIKIPFRRDIGKKNNQKKDSSGVE